MLIDHLLFPIGNQHHYEAVKSGDDSPELKAIHEKQRDGNLFPAHLFENGIL